MRQYLFGGIFATDCCSIFLAAVRLLLLVHSSFLHCYPESFAAKAFVHKHLDSISQKNKLFAGGNDKE